jgi:hypothetical protein
VHAAHVVLRQGDATRKLVLHAKDGPSDPSPSAVARVQPDRPAEEITLAQRDDDEGAGPEIGHRSGNGSRLARAIERLRAAAASRGSAL